MDSSRPAENTQSAHLKARRHKEAAILVGPRWGNGKQRKCPRQEIKDSPTDPTGRGTKGEKKTARVRVTRTKQRRGSLVGGGVQKNETAERKKTGVLMEACDIRGSRNRNGPEDDSTRENMTPPIVLREGIGKRKKTGKYVNQE